MDAATVQAVARFQQQHNLPVNGQVDEATLNPMIADRVAVLMHDHAIHLVVDLNDLDITTDTLSVHFVSTQTAPSAVKFETGGVRVITLGPAAFANAAVLHQEIDDAAAGGGPAAEPARPGADRARPDGRADRRAAELEQDRRPALGDDHPGPADGARRRRLERRARPARRRLPAAQRHPGQRADRRQADAAGDGRAAEVQQRERRDPAPDRRLLRLRRERQPDLGLLRPDDGHGQGRVRRRPPRRRAGGQHPGRPGGDEPAVRGDRAHARARDGAHPPAHRRPRGQRHARVPRPLDRRDGRGHPGGGRSRTTTR